MPGADAIPPFQSGLGQGFRVTDGRNFAVLSRMNQIRRAGVVGCDDGQTTGQRFGDNERKAILDRRKEQQVGSLIAPHVLLQTETSRPFNGQVGVPSQNVRRIVPNVAFYSKDGIGDLLADQAKRLEKVGRSFAQA